MKLIFLLKDIGVLASFNAPPLDEVVVGVQFATPTQYNSTHLADIFNLFRVEFPKIDEQLRLEPQFETFGGNASPGMQMHFGPPPVRNRALFISENDNVLLQFQDDKLLLNWRQGMNAAVYPRFENVVSLFEESLSKIADYFLNQFGVTLTINQAEVGYVNIVRVNSFENVESYFKILQPMPIDVEGFSLNLSEVVKVDNRSVARLYHEAGTVFSVDGRQKAIRYALTLRGKPMTDDLQSAKKFIHMGHETIVSRFEQITTELAHQEWGRE